MFILLLNDLEPGGWTSLIIVAEDDSRFAPGEDDAYYRNDPVNWTLIQPRRLSGITAGIPCTINSSSPSRWRVTSRKRLTKNCVLISILLHYFLNKCILISFALCLVKSVNSSDYQELTQIILFVKIFLMSYLNTYWALTAL
ncbi:Uncharacterized protein FWK35_00005613 [Aphis craccivora]|uniref:Uncharacterized protein n=1 Tax=Aphis craccivora TaxID=307492 RepID=A0A6G0ZN91_APHCR|nr:Uncharacterized protein FWK35_00005613 [Aphis craccivora]